MEGEQKKEPPKKSTKKISIDDSVVSDPMKAIPKPLFS